MGLFPHVAQSIKRGDSFSPLTPWGPGGPPGPPLISETKRLVTQRECCRSLPQTPLAVLGSNLQPGAVHPATNMTSLDPRGPRARMCVRACSDVLVLFTDSGQTNGDVPQKK